MKYTFDQLKNMTAAELEAARIATLDKLCAKKQAEWAKIAAILFYQDQLEAK